MRLLFDENLSPRLVDLLAGRFPESAHVHDEGLGEAPDEKMWDFALENGFVIVTKDADFHTLSSRRGHPPKVIWVRRGNCTTNEMFALLDEYHEALLEFGSDSVTAVLILS